MKPNDYQKQALTTRHISYADQLLQNTIWAMGVAGEAGEVLEKWKKIVAYNQGKISPAALAELKKELGDVIWYVAVLADGLGLSLQEIMELNLKKLADRQARKVITGEGDNR